MNKSKLLVNLLLISPIANTASLFCPANDSCAQLTAEERAALLMDPVQGEQPLDLSFKSLDEESPKTGLSLEQKTTPTTGPESEPLSPREQMIDQLKTRFENYKRTLTYIRKNYMNDIDDIEQYIAIANDAFADTMQIAFPNETERNIRWVSYFFSQYRHSAPVTCLIQWEILGLLTQRLIETRESLLVTQEQMPYTTRPLDAYNAVVAELSAGPAAQLGFLVLDVIDSEASTHSATPIAINNPDGNLEDRFEVVAEPTGDEQPAPRGWFSSWRGGR